jgi:DNA-binding NarL/FixJ family response regulator
MGAGASCHEVFLDGRRLWVFTSSGLIAEAALSAGDAQVARLAARGFANAAIAAQRGTSPRTVANQIARVLSKLRLPSRHALAARVLFDDLASDLQRQPDQELEEP